MPFYAVREGRKPGVYTSWPECQKQINDFKRPKYKKFDTEEEAQAFVDGEDKPQKKADASNGKPSEKRTNPDDDTKETKKQKTDDETKSASKTDNESVSVYIHGTCFFKGKDGQVAGIGVYWGDSDSKNVSERLNLEGKLTNHRADIQAACKAIEQAKEADIKKISIHSDSQFLINCTTKWMEGWKKKDWVTSAGKEVANKEDIVMLDKLMDGIKIDWVDMTDNKEAAENEASRNLAKEGAKKPLPSA